MPFSHTLISTRHRLSVHASFAWLQSLLRVGLGVGACLGLPVLAAPGFQFVALGDLPYGAPAVSYAPYRSLIAQINRESPAFSIHVGDFKSGSTPCSNEEFQAQLGHFSLFEKALVYTPGDNEWTDCHRSNNGAHDPLERLGKLRQMFFQGGQSLGQQPLTLPMRYTPILGIVAWVVWSIRRPPR